MIVSMERERIFRASSIRKNLSPQEEKRERKRSEEKKTNQRKERLPLTFRMKGKAVLPSGARDKQKKRGVASEFILSGKEEKVKIARQQSLGEKGESAYRSRKGAISFQPVGHTAGKKKKKRC